jgi:DNA-binding transcriptional LysR family regulator
MKQLDGLLEFLAVVDHGGFTAAAASLGVSASFVSRRVSDLEARLGVRLLHRTTRRVNLTDIGLLYMERNRAVLEQIESIESEIAERQNLVTGTVRVAAGGWYGERVVTAALAGLCQQHPRLRIELELSDRRVDLIRDGFDLAVRHGGPGDPDLVGRQVSARRVVVAATPAYLARKGTPQTPDELASHDCLVAPLQPWRFVVDEAVIEQSVSGPLASNSGPALREAALTGLGIVRLAEEYLANAIADGRLVRLLERFELPTSPTYIVYPSRERVPLRVRCVIDHLVAVLQAG